MRSGKSFLASALLSAALCAGIFSAAWGFEGAEFTLESVGGERVSLRQAAAGKPVLLVFWATWCPHCNEAVPEINGIQSRLSDRLRILAIDFMESRGKVKAFMKAKSVAYTVLLDSNGKVARQYKVLGIPTYVLLDKEGRVVYSGNDLPGSLEKYL
jgi:thiol-disulfide isomerase/thioredoxin